MAQEVINTGTLPNDGKGDTLRVAGQKINNNFAQLFVTGTVADNTARQTANAAFAAANTKIAKAGDVVTGQLIFRTNANNAYPNTKIGNIFEANSIDIFAGNENDFAQLNWANSNFVIVDSDGVVATTANTSIEVKDDLERVLVRVNTNTWSFESNGRITLFDSATAERSTFAPGFRNTIVVNSATHNASNTNDVIFADPLTANANVNINLSANADVGKTFTIKNISESAFFVRVNGTERAYPYIEDPSTGTFVNTVNLLNIPGDSGECHTWVFQGGVYRSIT
jgi:hypothetical protein